MMYYFYRKVGIKFFILFVAVLLFTFCFTCFCLPIQGDEIWNYGFSYNISKGMVVYRDFNVLQTPFYFFIGSVFIHFFGDYLISLHLMDAILVAIMFLMLFKMLGWKSLIVYPFVLLIAIPSYNLLCLFWLFFMLYLIYLKKDDDLIMGILVSMLFLTKQNVGICLFFVYVILSKNKFKSIGMFLIPILMMVIYLILNDSFVSFFNYCFLGMFDFAEKNDHFIDKIFVFLEGMVVIYLIFKIIRSNFKDKSLYYILAFQVMVYPIIDVFHFLICFVPVLFLLVRDIKISFRLNMILCILFLFSFASIPKISEINRERNFLYLRSNIDLSLIEMVYSKYEKESTYHFFCFTNAYLFKLYIHVPITKYDFMANGNMGYHGSERYIKEISDMCKEQSCVFFLDEHMFDMEDTQFSKEIFNYVINHYSKVEEYDYFSVFSNY